MSLQTAATQLPGFAGPLYVQVAGILRDKICASEWTARAPLPNEVTLARDIGVSIGTVRKALEMLENEHLIQRRQGRGTFVVETSHETELMLSRGLRRRARQRTKKRKRSIFANWPKFAVSKRYGPPVI
jgi:DNA-binding GntR family transcriptional regulator